MVVLNWYPLFILILISILCLRNKNKEIINSFDYHSLFSYGSKPVFIINSDLEHRHNNLIDIKKYE